MASVLQIATRPPLRQAPILGRPTRLSNGKSVDEKTGTALQQDPLDVRMPTRKSYRHDSFTLLMGRSTARHARHLPTIVRMSE